MAWGIRVDEVSGTTVIGEDGVGVISGTAPGAQ